MKAAWSKIFKFLRNCDNIGDLMLISKNLLILFLTNNFITAEVELRAYVKSIDHAKKVLYELGALFKGEYSFTDYIYKYEQRGIPVGSSYCRIREYHKTNWNQKMISLTVKEEKACLVKREFDSIAGAKTVLKQLLIQLIEDEQKNYMHQYGADLDQDTIQELHDWFEQEKCKVKNDLGYLFAFQFSRRGWEYQGDYGRLFLEDIEYLKPSIEIISESQKSIDFLLKILFVKWNDKIVFSVPFEIEYRNKMGKLLNPIFYRQVGFLE